MPDTQLLHIALQDGFFKDSITVSVDGKELVNRSDVTTKTQVGLAGTVELRLPPGQVSLRVSVTGRPPSDVLTIELTHPVYVGVSIGADGTTLYQCSENPFRHA